MIFFKVNCLKKKIIFALDYLKKRKLSEEIIKKFKLGFVPKNNNFFDHLLKKYSIRGY